MLPLMLAGAGLQYAGAQDKATAVSLAMKQYMANLKAFQARQAQRYAGLNTGLDTLRPTFGQNIGSLAQGVTDQSAITAGTGAAKGEMGDAVAQARAGTAGVGAMDYSAGNQANMQLGHANAEQYADRLDKSTSAAALDKGLQAGDQASQAAVNQYGLEDQSLQRKIAELFGQVDVGNAADALGRSVNEQNGTNRMHFAQGQGNSSIQAGQYAQMLGLLMGAYGGAGGGQRQSSALAAGNPGDQRALSNSDGVDRMAS